MSKKRKLFYFFLLAAAFFCVLYGIAVYMVHSGTLFYAVWFLIAVCLLLLARAVRKELWKLLPKWVRIGVLTVCGLLLALFLTVEGLILSGFGSKAEAGLDYIIVLGAQVHEDGPSYVLMRRLTAAEAYLNENPDTLCIVTGGQGANEPFSEAQGMADWLIGHGIAEERILTEDRATSTAENIRFSKAFIPDGASVGIVTNNFHIYRAVQTAKRYGIENARGIACGLRIYYLPNNMLREFLSVLKFWVMG